MMIANQEKRHRQALFENLKALGDKQSALIYVRNTLGKYTVMEMCDILNLETCVFEQSSARGYSYNPLQYQILEDGTIANTFVPFLTKKLDELGISNDLKSEYLSFLTRCFYLGAVQDTKFDLHMLYQWTSSSSKLKFDALNAIKAYEDWINNRIDQPYAIDMNELNNAFLTLLQAELQKLLDSNCDTFLLHLIVKLLIEQSLIYKKGYHKPEFEWLAQKQIVIVQADLSTIEGRILKELLDVDLTFHPTTQTIRVQIE